MKRRTFIKGLLGCMVTSIASILLPREDKWHSIVISNYDGYDSTKDVEFYLDGKLITNGDFTSWNAEVPLD